MTKEYSTHGTHLWADFYECKNINDEEAVLVPLLYEAVIRTGNKPIDYIYHKFEPQGVSCVVLLKESHLSYHSYPEHKFVAIDIYCCGNAKPIKGYAFLRDKLSPKYVVVNQVMRGCPKCVMKLIPDVVG